MDTDNVTSGSKIEIVQMRVDSDLVSPENEVYLKAKAMRRLLDEAEKGWDSAAEDGWISEEEAYRLLGIGD